MPHEQNSGVGCRGRGKGCPRIWAAPSAPMGGGPAGGPCIHQRGLADILAPVDARGPFPGDLQGAFASTSVVSSPMYWRPLPRACAGTE